jgi:small multidrug resistance family-3 protein
MKNGKSKKILVTVFFFVLAGLFEIGGGYLIWLWLREDRGWLIGMIGGFVFPLWNSSNITAGTFS